MTTEIPRTGKPAPGEPDIEITDAVSCGSPDVGSRKTCDRITVRSVGTKPLKITSVEFTGSKEFELDRKGTTCVLHKEIRPQSSCVLSVSFEPAETGSREGRAVVHQNLPGPASEVYLTGGESEPDTTTSTTRPPEE